LKVTGIYVVIAVLLTLLFDAQLRSTHDASARRSKEFAFVVACATATVVFLVVLVHRRLGIAEAVNFILPGSGIVMFLVWSEKVLPRFGAGLRLRSVLRPFSWFALGLTVPILAFISPYIASNSLGSLIEGVIVAPSARLEFAAMKPPSIVSLPVSVLALIAFLGIGYGLSRARFAGRAAVMGLLATAFVLTATPYGYRITWFSVRDASLLLVPVGIAFLVTAIRSGLSNSTENVRTFALLAVFAFATLIQFPFSASLYFFYVVPLVFLAMLALAAHWRDGSLPVLHPFAVAGAFLFLAAFGIARLNEEFVGGRASIGEGAPLGLARSGPLRVSPADARLYRRVVARIQAVRASRYIYAGPDAPEVYFLSNRRNPTRAEFEFFERGSTQGRELLQVLNRYGVSLVALNLRPQFSPPLDSRVLAALSSRYPHHERIGRFELRWRT
jgi:hypothetical protein